MARLVSKDTLSTDMSSLFYNLIDYKYHNNDVYIEWSKILAKCAKSSRIIGIWWKDTGIDFR